MEFVALSFNFFHHSSRVFISVCARARAPLCARTMKFPFGRKSKSRELAHHTRETKGKKAFERVCVCVCVCPFPHKEKTIGVHFCIGVPCNCWVCWSAQVGVCGGMPEEGAKKKEKGVLRKGVSKVCVCV